MGKTTKQFIGIGVILLAMYNIVLFAIAGFKIGKKFFFGSLLGTVVNSVFLDLCKEEKVQGEDKKHLSAHAKPAIM